MFMAKKMKIVCAIAGLLAIAGLVGCVSVPFEVAGDIIGATGDVVESVVEVPFDVAGAVIDIPSSFRCSLTEDRTYTEDSQGVERIDIRNGDGAVIVHGTDSDRIEIRVHKTVYSSSNKLSDKYSSEMRIYTTKENQTMRIYSSPEDDRHKHFCAVIRYDIDIPRRMNVKADVQNSTVELNRIEGDFEIVSNNGRIQMDRCSGSVYARANNGEIKADMDNLWSRGEFISHNGSLDVTLYEIRADLRMETHNGRIDLRIPERFSGILKAETDNGEVHCEYPIRVKNPRNNHLSGQIGDGDGPTIDLRSHNGSVKIAPVEISQESR